MKIRTRKSDDSFRTDLPLPTLAMLAAGALVKRCRTKSLGSRSHNTDDDSSGWVKAYSVPRAISAVTTTLRPLLWVAEALDIWNHWHNQFSLVISAARRGGRFEPFRQWTSRLVFGGPVGGTNRFYNMLGSGRIPRPGIVDFTPLASARASTTI